MMNDDYYFYDEEHFVMVGKRTGTIYRLGQEVTVTLVKADVERKQIDFVLGEVDNLMLIQEQLKQSSNKSKGRNSSSKRGSSRNSSSNRSSSSKSRSNLKIKSKGGKKKTNKSKKSKHKK